MPTWPQGSAGEVRGGIPGFGQRHPRVSLEGLVTPPPTSRKARLVGALLAARVICSIESLGYAPPLEGGVDRWHPLMHRQRSKSRVGTDRSTFYRIQGLRVRTAVTTRAAHTP